MKSSAAVRTSSPPERFVEVERVVDRIDVGSVTLARAGLCVSTPWGESLTGSAASLGGDPLPRARFELWERIATVEAAREQSTFTSRDASGRAIGLIGRGGVFPESDDPATWRASRSNGVALHEDWASARDRAWWELCERDRVLRAWHGYGRPTLLEGWTEARLAAIGATHTWCAAMFDGEAGPPGAIEVAGVFGFPVVETAPLVVGYAARPERSRAIEAAVDEALQLLAFLWGEEVPSAVPPPGPTAMHHLERLLWPGSATHLRSWLERGHMEHAMARPLRPLPVEADAFVDLTPPWADGVRVVRALAEDAWPLRFGESPASMHLPAHLRLHPIP